jgi:glutaredoxin
VYLDENCPNCERLKSSLKELEIAFEEKDLETKEAIIELRYLAGFPREAPVLR